MKYKFLISFQFSSFNIEKNYSRFSNSIYVSYSNVKITNMYFVYGLAKCFYFVRIYKITSVNISNNYVENLN